MKAFEQGREVCRAGMGGGVDSATPSLVDHRTEV